MSSKLIPSMSVGFVLAFAPVVLADQPKEKAAQEEAARENQPKVPATPEDHFALAKTYQEKAAAYRKEAQEHRKMAAAFRKGPLNAQKPRGQENPRVKKMEQHCAAIATAADKLAVENQKAADFHTLRGKELKGQ